MAASNLNYLMKQTMRWFGPNDPVSLRDIRQSGCTGVVSALHHIPNGAVWTVDEIQKRKAEIEAAGLMWDVVESLPIHEAIKTQAPGYGRFYDAYCQSLINLAACGVDIVTYNFMPLLDWTRTKFDYAMPDGALALKFELDAVAAYDIFMLKRPNAAADYSSDMVAKARLRFENMTSAQRTLLERNIIAGLPGSEESYSSDDFLRAIDTYAQIDHATLKSHLIDFLRAVCPTADAHNIKLVIHPDDPPFDMFGLPRVVSTQDDLAAIFEAVPNISNGLCFCVGSFSIREDNDLVAMIRRFGQRIYFTHLRNTRREANGDFYESAHLDGSFDMYDIVKEMHAVSVAHRRRIPMRPDHGHQMLDDLKKGTNAGYSAIGRLRGMAELRGLELGIAKTRIDLNT
jgi:mannonate dehydratase